MRKKITTLDIAREAGVSIATVSYILNDRKDVRISEATRKKVLQICNLNQYVPSQIAKSLATGKNHIVGILFNSQSGSVLRNVQTYNLIRDLQDSLQGLGYDTLILPELSNASEIRVQRNIDGIICIDLSEKQFYELKENYYIPIISLDMIIPDPLFYKLYDDVSAVLQCGKKLLGAEKINFITENSQNENFTAYVKEAVKNDILHIFSDYADLQNFLTAQKDGYFVINGENLALMCIPFISQHKTAVACSDASQSVLPPNVKKIFMPTKTKAKLAVDMLQNAIDRTEKVQKEIKLCPQN